MNIRENLNTLVDTKEKIKSVLEEKGIDTTNKSFNDYSDLIDNISPTLVNPLNGNPVGTSTSYGTVTYQYQVNGGTISSCALFYTQHDKYGETSGLIGDQSYPYPYPDVELYGNNCSYSINNTGLLTVLFNRTQSEVNEYEWLSANGKLGIIINLTNGISLIDYSVPYTTFSCLIKDTEISLANRGIKKIQDITYDDDLLVWNFDDGKYDNAKPLWIKKTQVTNWYYKLIFSNGRILKVTGTYPEAHSLFSVDDGKFIHANRLVGKRVYTLDGIATLDSCEEIHEEVKFYNIITDYHMNLFADGILTSTSLNNIYPIQNMMFIKDTHGGKTSCDLFGEKQINGLRLHEQPTDVTDYCNNLIKLAK